MRETSIPDNLNCVYATMLGCAMKIKKELELEKKQNLVEIFCAVIGSTLKGCGGIIMLLIDMKITTRIRHNIKVLVL